MLLEVTASALHPGSGQRKATPVEEPVPELSCGTGSTGGLQEHWTWPTDT